MKEPTQEETKECVSNAVKKTLKALTEDTQQASTEIQEILQLLQNKYNTLEFEVKTYQSQTISGVDHMCFIGVKLI